MLMMLCIRIIYLFAFLGVYGKENDSFGAHLYLIPPYNTSPVRSKSLYDNDNDADAADDVGCLLLLLLFVVC